MNRKCSVIGWCLAAALCAGCGSLPTESGTAEASGSSSTAASSSSGAEPAAAQIHEEDSETGYDEASAVKIQLNGSSIDISGTGAAADGSVLTISEAGDYLLSGTLDSGRIVIDAGKNDTVRLILNGVQVTCPDNAPLYAKQADKTIVTLVEGTENTLSDGGSAYALESGADEPDAAVFCKDSLTINGAGILTVQSGGGNGIGTKDDLVITGGDLRITSANHGIRGRDSVSVSGGTFQIDAAADGIQSNNDEDAEKGWIALEGGTYQITAGNDGIQAETSLSVSGGDYSLNCGGGSGATPADAEGSYKGLKSGGNLTISGGAFHVDSADDSIHSNGNVTVDGGTFTLSSGDDGMHADGDLLLNSGEITIEKSYEGLEGATVTMNGGTVRLTAQDDGVNAAGGSDSTEGRQQRGGPDSFRAAGNDSYFIRITGGTLVIDASGDGIDSNGALYIDGGTVQVNGPEGNGNGALDFVSSCDITGGTLLAAGSSGMAQSPGETSTQCSLTVFFQTAQAAGTPVTLADSSGNEVVSFAPTKQYQSLVISVPELQQGGTYTVYSGDLSGTKLCEVTLSSVSTRISSDGSEAAGGMMGRGGFGGGRGGGKRGEMPQGGTPPERLPDMANGEPPQPPVQ